MKFILFSNNSVFKDFIHLQHKIIRLEDAGSYKLFLNYGIEPEEINVSLNTIHENMELRSNQWIDLNSFTGRGLYILKAQRLPVPLKIRVPSLLSPERPMNFQGPIFIC